MNWSKRRLSHRTRFGWQRPEPEALKPALLIRWSAVRKVDATLEFWAPWRGPCVGMAPQFERASQQLKGRVLFAKVNSDENPPTARRFQIRSIPTLVRLKADWNWPGR